LKYHFLTSGAAGGPNASVKKSRADQSETRSSSIPSGILFTSTELWLICLQNKELVEVNPLFSFHLII
jgi:hypothetical protein